MPTVLNENARLLKAFMALLLALAACPPLGAAELGQPPREGAGISAPATLPSRNFVTATLSDGLDLACAPLHWEGRDWAAMAVPALGLVALIKTDPQSYALLHHKQDWLESSMPIATDFGEGAYAALGTAGLWGLGEALGQDELAASSSSALEAMAFCAVASPVFKYAFAGDRPSEGEQDRRLFDYGYPGASPSFPSGHTLVAFALAETYGASYGRYWTYPLACIVAYSRIYLGAHWASDVAAGALLGAAMGHVAVTSREGKGAPRSWKFSLGPDERGNMVAEARIRY